MMSRDSKLLSAIVSTLLASLDCSKNIDDRAFFEAGVFHAERGTTAPFMATAVPASGALTSAISAATVAAVVSIFCPL